MALTFKVINSNGKFVEAVTIIFFRFHETGAAAEKQRRQHEKAS